MKGVYKGIDCFTDDYRIDGVWHKALIYQVKDEGDDEKALTEAGFVDMQNDLWVRAVTIEEYRSIIGEFKKQKEVTDKQQIVQRRKDNEEDIKRNAIVHAENERMASRRVKMRVLKLEFAGASLFAELVSFILLYASVINRFDKNLKTLALPIGVSLVFMPLIIIGAAAAAFKRIPEIYIAIAGLMLTSALIAWDTASIMLVVIAAAFVTFYFITRCINQYKKEPEYPTYFDKTLSDIK